MSTPEDAYEAGYKDGERAAEARVRELEEALRDWYIWWRENTDDSPGQDVITRTRVALAGQETLENVLETGIESPANVANCR